ncbi:MAG: DHH family phosphoesterase [Erysipelotrichaceae bacterium]|nr:DHH family phosphoesterase [Erysipelotrichaceae bacterium]
METKKIGIISLIGILALACTAYFSYNAGQNKGFSIIEEEYKAEREYLYNLNRGELEHLDLTSDRFYLIGHKSPDADTVISAIVGARLFRALGFNAIPATAEKADFESQYILEKAGVEEPEILYDVSGLDIMMVDHNEYNQAADGMQDAHIIGIIDHHGIGSVTTGNVVYGTERPIGAVCTIMWMNYLNYGVEIDQNTAFLLLGAILSDTGNLVGTFTTSTDIEAVKSLSKIAGVEDTDAFYKEMYAEKLSYKGMSDLEILLADYKEYESGNTRFGIAMANAIDEESASKLAKRLAAVLPEGFESKNVDLMYAEVSIREEGVKIDYIVPVDDYSKKVFEDAFPNYDEYDGTSFIFRSGLGRKTKFVPGLTDFLASYPHE